MIHARKTAIATAEDDQFTIAIDGEPVAVVPAIGRVKDQLNPPRK